MNIEEAKKHLSYILKALHKENFEYHSKVNPEGFLIYEKTDSELAIETVLAELEKKEAVINEMSNCINLMSNELVAETGVNNLEFCKMQKCIDNGELDCEDCIKEYFTNKVEREGK